MHPILRILHPSTRILVAVRLIQQSHSSVLNGVIRVTQLQIIQVVQTLSKIG